MAGLDPEGLRAFLAEAFPQALAVGFEIERADAEGVRLHLVTDERHLRPGGVVMGPTQMMLVDTAAYLAILARRGEAAALAVTSSLDVHFLRAVPPGDVWVETRVLRMGRRLAVVVATLTAGTSPEPLAHATVTYALPDAASDGLPPSPNAGRRV